MSEGRALPAPVDVGVHIDRVDLALRLQLRAGAPARLDEDLRSAGYLGLMLAARDFDARRGVPFAAFAMHRIRGEMLDLMRREGLRGYQRGQAGAPRVGPLDSAAAAHAPESAAAADLRRRDLRAGIFGCLDGPLGRVVAAVLDEGSQQAAARLLGVSGPTLSRRMADACACIRAGGAL